MNYKSAVCLEEKVEKVVDPTMTQLTNPFHFHKVEKAQPVSNERLLEIARSMRQRWEAYHVQNGTWYDYSDDGSWYSEEEEEWEEEVEDEKCWD